MKDDTVYLRHILDALVKIESYISVGHDAFFSDTHWQDAVIRQLEIMGEATKRLSHDLRARHPSSRLLAIETSIIFPKSFMVFRPARNTKLSSSRQHGFSSPCCNENL